MKLIFAISMTNDCNSNKGDNIVAPKSKYTYQWS